MGCAQSTEPVATRDVRLQETEESEPDVIIDGFSQEAAAMATALELTEVSPPNMP